MAIAESTTYLNEICDELAKHWPDNRTVNIVCHGHSVPSGYYCTPFVDPFHAYPFLMFKLVKERFPYAVINVITTAIGGENSRQGAERFEETVLNHKPDVLTIDYGLNDRQITLKEAEQAWRFMIEKSLEKNIKVILLTPSWEQSVFKKDESWQLLVKHTEQIRLLADEYEVGLSDTFAEFQQYIDQGNAPQDLMCHVNHPSSIGHEIIALSLSRWFIAR